MLTKEQVWTLYNRYQEWAREGREDGHKPAFLMYEADAEIGEEIGLAEFATGDPTYNTVDIFASTKADDNGIRTLFSCPLEEESVPEEPEWFSDDDWARAVEAGGWLETVPPTYTVEWDEWAVQGLQTSLGDMTPRPPAPIPVCPQAAMAHEFLFGAGKC